MASLQNMAVIAFSLLALYLLPSPSRAALPLACLSAACACASSANGFLLAPVGLLLLLPAAASPASLAWIVLFPAMLALYLFRYQRPIYATASTSFLLKPLFFLSFVGPAFEKHARPPHPASRHRRRPGSLPRLHARGHHPLRQVPPPSPSSPSSGSCSQSH